MKKATKIIGSIILALVLLGGFWYLKKGEKSNFKNKLSGTSSLEQEAGLESSSVDSQKMQKDSSELAVSEEEKKANDWMKKCEAGETIILEEKAEEGRAEISGKISIDYAEDQDVGEYFLVNDAGKQQFSGADWADLDLLEGRAVLLQGSSKNGLFLPSTLRCLVSQKEKITLEYRRQIMTEAEKRIGEISGQKGAFAVESFWWQTDEYFYVDFYDKDDEDIFFEALVFVKKDGEKNIFEKVALFKNSGPEGDWELVSGRDLFEDATDSESEDNDDNYYEFDENLKLWSPVY